MPCWAMMSSDSRIQPSRLSGYVVAAVVAVAAAVVAAGVAAEALVALMSGRASTAAPVPATASFRARRAVRA